jgi:hypothetical protein
MFKIPFTVHYRAFCTRKVKYHLTIGCDKYLDDTEMMLDTIFVKMNRGSGET